MLQAAPFPTMEWSSYVSTGSYLNNYSWNQTDMHIRAFQ